jgi:hypothetical protein
VGFSLGLSLSIKEQFYNQFETGCVSGAFSGTYARWTFEYIALPKQLIILYAMVIKTSSV